MKIEIYTKPTCSFCARAKDALKKRGHSYTEYVVGQDATKETIQNRINSLGIATVVRTVPQIFIDEEYVGGYDELRHKYNWND